MSALRAERNFIEPVGLTSEHGQILPGVFNSQPDLPATHRDF